MYPLPENIEKEFKLEHSHIIKRSDEIIEIRCLDDFTYELPHIKENHECLKKLAEEKKLLVLNFAGKYTSVSNEARAYIALGNHKDFIKAEAFLIHGLAQKILANFFLKISKPIVPAAAFNYQDKVTAEKWLLDHNTSL